MFEAGAETLTLEKRTLWFGFEISKTEFTSVQFLDYEIHWRQKQYHTRMSEANYKI